LALEMSLGELPLIVSLPFEQVLRLGARLIQMGAAAVSIAGPRGLLPLPDSPSAGDPTLLVDKKPGLVSGRLFGPGLFAQSLLLVRDAARAGIPIIGSAGVYSARDVEAMLAAGALAVQVDTALWRGDFNPA
jgi:dihydroorotate dehydrogenase (NAD+) catalytic subunit